MKCDDFQVFPCFTCPVDIVWADFFIWSVANIFTTGPKCPEMPQSAAPGWWNAKHLRLSWRSLEPPMTHRQWYSPYGQRWYVTATYPSWFLVIPIDPNFQALIDASSLSLLLVNASKQMPYHCCFSLETSWVVTKRYLLLACSLDIKGFFFQYERQTFCSMCVALFLKPAEDLKHIDLRAQVHCFYLILSNGCLIYREGTIAYRLSLVMIP